MIQMPTADRPFTLHCGDCIEAMNGLPDDSVDLVIGSPPYMDARTYGIDALRDCEEWVAWMLEVTKAAVRVSKGLVLWVAAGVQRDLCYWPGCEGLMWEWWKSGNQLWRPCIWHKVDQNGGGTGIPGSGGKQWFRNDWEYCMAFKKEGWLPWADNVAMGHTPKYAEVGGEMSNRTADGRRINEEVGFEVPADPWNHGNRGPGRGGRRKSGEKKMSRMDVMGGHESNGELKPNVSRPMPAIANPGNFLTEPMEPGMIVRGRVGGGHMGSDLCHENEAPYPVAVPEFFVKSFCPPDGIVLDCFSGSGTTGHAALENGRRYIGIDIRESQIELSRRRLESGITPSLFT